MFYTEQGWLKYTPFKRYQLPELLFVNDQQAHFVHHSLAKTAPGALIQKDGTLKDRHVFVKLGKDGQPTRFVDTDKKYKEDGFVRPLYTLRWPGAVTGHGVKYGWDDIPESVLQGWPSYDIQMQLAAINGPEQAPISKGLGDNINHMLRLDPEKPRRFELPEAVQYHLAVNRHVYWPRLPRTQFPVCGLPPVYVDLVLDAQFALTGEQVATLQYLKWLAEGHHEHPLFCGTINGLDTTARDALHGITEEAVRLYFKTLNDFRYDSVGKWWSRTDKDWWWKYATYLHWVGRVGCGLYDTFAQIDISCEAETLPPGLADRMRFWWKADFGREGARIWVPKINIHTEAPVPARPFQPPERLIRRRMSPTQQRIRVDIDTPPPEGVVFVHQLTGERSDPDESTQD